MAKKATKPEKPKLRLEWRTAVELADNPRNWRVHSPNQKAALEEQMKVVGWAGACLYNERTKRLLDGHLRKSQANGSPIPVLIGSWTEKQENLILTTLDPIASLAEANKDALGSLLLELDGQSDGIQTLLDQMAQDYKIDLFDEGGGEGMTDPDAVPDAPSEPVAKRGDLFRMGDHVLLCGDSTSQTDVERLMVGKLADCLWTDPPYGVDYEGKTKEALTIKNDGAAGLGMLLDGAFSRAMEATKKGAAWYVAAPAGPQYLDFANRMLNLGVLRQSLVWVKNQFVLGRQDYNWQHEAVLYGWKEGGPHKWYGLFDKTTLFDDQQPLEKMTKEKLLTMLQAIRDESTVIREDRPRASIIHPTMKPVALISRMIFNSTKKGDIVLDLFGGSGSTMIACQKLGRKCRMVELDPHYTDVIIRRWEEFAGQKAERVKG